MLDKDRKVTVTEDSLVWGRWYESGENRTVKRTEVCGYIVSTVFLGLDHAYASGDPDDGEPVLWETMVFDGDGKGGIASWADLDMLRCAGTWEDAEDMHNVMCATVRAALGVTQ